jgi:hypothetical protein
MSSRMLILFEDESIFSNILPAILPNTFGLLIYPKSTDLLLLLAYQKNTTFCLTMKYNNEYNPYQILLEDQNDNYSPYKLGQPFYDKRPVIIKRVLKGLFGSRLHFKVHHQKKI